MYKIYGFYFVNAGQVPQIVLRGKCDYPFLSNNSPHLVFLLLASF